MDDELVRNDRTYISTSLAAELSGYSQDYVGQLARDGHIESVKVGHKRFVGRDDLISYALDNKSSLSVSDIPENHLPEPLQDTDGEEEPEDDKQEKNAKESKAADDDLQTVEGEGGEGVDEGHESIVLPNEETYRNQERSAARPDPVGRSLDGVVTETVDVSDRAHMRWQKSREGLRQHAEPAKPARGHSKVPKIIATLLALVVSFGLWVGPLTESDQNLGRVALNVSQASDRAYHALGVGLHHQLEQYGPLGTIHNSLRETSGMLTAQVNRALEAGGQSSDKGSSMQPDNVAAAGSTARSFSNTLNALVPDTSWLTEPASADSTSFRDYQPQPILARTQLRISQKTEEGLSDQESAEKIDQSDKPNKGAVVVPAPESAEARRDKREEIRSQFSDPVEVTASSSNSGVVQPQFGDRQGDEYMYIMVPRPVK